MLKKNLSPAWCIALIVAGFSSCVSTRQYTKTESQAFQGEDLIFSETKLERDGKVIQSESQSYYSAEMDDMEILATKTSNSKESYDVTNIRIFQGESLIAEKDFKSKDGKLVTNTTTTSTSTSSLSETEKYQKEILEKAYDLIQETANDSSDESDDDLKVVKKIENVQVESTPNKGYIGYSIIGKPLVIAGTSAWNMVKAFGYALWNFTAGYSITSGSEHISWKMPDTKKAKEKAQQARANNGISAYPEYHLPFTDNHITVEVMNTEQEGISVSEEEVKVTSTEQYEYDNTISVSRSSEADAASTASVIGMVGTAVTIPISVLTYVGGASFGIYAQVAGH